MTYFSTLFRYDKRIFFLVAAFCLLTAIANLFKVETTPFFVWGMYSEKEPSDRRLELFKITVNDSIPVDYSCGYPDANRFYLLSPLTYSRSMAKNGGEDPEKVFFQKKLGRYFDLIIPFEKHLFNESLNKDAFMQWYSTYLEETMHVPIDDLKIELLDGDYNDRNQVEIYHSEGFIQWKKR